MCSLRDCTINYWIGVEPVVNFWGMLLIMSPWVMRWMLLGEVPKQNARIKRNSLSSGTLPIWNLQTPQSWIKSH